MTFTWENIWNLISDYIRIWKYLSIYHVYINVWMLILKIKLTNLISRKKTQQLNTNLVYSIVDFFFSFNFLFSYFYYYYHLFIKVTLGSSDRTTQPCIYFIYYNTLCTFFFLYHRCYYFWYAMYCPQCSATVNHKPE